MDAIVELFATYRLIAVFFGSFFFGDSVIITTAYLAGQQHWAVVPIFLVAVLGTVVADTLWFLLGAFMAQHGSHIRLFEKQRDQAARLMEKITGKHPHLALVYIKFLYGARIAMILYAATRGMSFRTFTIYNTFGVMLWFIIFFPLGYLAGRGVAKVMPFAGALETALVVLVASFIIVRLFNIWLTKEVEKE